MEVTNTLERLIYPRGVGPLGRHHRRYLKNRGFDPDELADIWGIQGTTWDSDYKWRIIIPVKFEGCVVSWTSRSTTKNTCCQRRYLSATPEHHEAVPLKSTLYGWDYRSSSVIVVEGPTDVWRIGPGAVATFGARTTEEQIDLLASCPKVYVCFDSDEPVAWKRAHRLCRSLASRGRSPKLLKLTCHDPGGAGEAELDELRKLMRS